jgi:hypothetical protein
LSVFTTDDNGTAFYVNHVLVLTVYLFLTWFFFCAVVCNVHDRTIYGDWVLVPLTALFLDLFLLCAGFCAAVAYTTVVLYTCCVTLVVYGRGDFGWVILSLGTAIPITACFLYAVKIARRNILEKTKPAADSNSASVDKQAGNN